MNIMVNNGRKNGMSGQNRMGLPFPSAPSQLPVVPSHCNVNISSVPSNRNKYLHQHNNRVKGISWNAVTKIRISILPIIVRILNRYNTSFVYTQYCFTEKYWPLATLDTHRGHTLDTAKPHIIVLLLLHTYLYLGREPASELATGESCRTSHIE